MVELSHLLELARSGDPKAQEEVLGALYEELRGIAKRQMRGQPADHTLQATALVNEAWMRLVPRGAEPVESVESDEPLDLSAPDRRGWNDRQHFLAVASKAMRCVLVDHARRRDAAKRQKPGERVALDRVLVCYETRALDLEALDTALDELEGFDEQMALAVELRFFGGQEMADIADCLGMSKRTLERRWQATRSWLKSRIQ